MGVLERAYFNYEILKTYVFLVDIISIFKVFKRHTQVKLAWAISRHDSWLRMDQQFSRMSQKLTVFDSKQ